MKIFLITVLLLALIIGGVIGYVYFGQSKSSATPSSKTQTTQNTVLTGVLSKATDPNGEYTHLLNSSSGIKGINSYTVRLDDYVGKKVSVTGQYSGKTLYADIVTVVQ